MKNQQTLKTRALLALAAVALVVVASPAAAQPARPLSGGRNWTARNVAELIAAVNAANAAGGVNTIILAPGKTYTLTAVNNTSDGPNGLPVIATNNNLTIRGNDATIARSTARGTPAFRLFDVASGAALTVQDLTLANGQVIGDAGKGACGGAILNEAGAALIVKSSTLAGNKVVGGDGAGSLGGLGLGGAICSDGAATLDSVIFCGNQAMGGATTSPDPTQPDTIMGGLALGGAVNSQNSGTLTVRNCWFSGNKAVGGHRHYPGAQYDGAGASGAIDSWGTAWISGTTFTDNQAIGGAGDEGAGPGWGFGGVLNNGGPLAQSPVCTIQRCAFSGNHAIGGGGGPNDYGGTGLAGALSTGYAQITSTMTITECAFNDNQAVGGDAGAGGWGGGGAINQESPLTLGNKSTLTIANSVFADNKALGSGVGALAWGGAIVNQNWNADDGSGATLVIANCAFAHNEAVATPGGDGVSTASIAQSGAVDTSGNSTIRNSVFMNNRAVGAALAPDATPGFFTTCCGGGLSSWGGTLDVRDSRFVGNQVVGGDGSLGGPAGSAMGGGITVFSGLTATFVNCSLFNNAALGGASGNGVPGGAGVGGGLSVGLFPPWAGLDSGPSSIVTLTGTTITYNQAVGGANGGIGMGGGCAVDTGILFGIPDTSTVTFNGGSVVRRNQPDNIFQVQP